MAEEIATPAPTAEGFAERESIDLKAIQSRIGEISEEIRHGFEPMESLGEGHRRKVLGDCISEFAELMKTLESQDPEIELSPEDLESYVKDLRKELRSVEEENRRAEKEIGHLTDNLDTAATKMEIDVEECDYMLKYVLGHEVVLQGHKSVELYSSQTSSFQHQEFEILELDRQIEESARNLKVMQDLDNSLKSFDTLAEFSSMLSAVKVLEVKENSARLFLTGPTFTSDGVLMGQKLDLSIEKPINSDHELFIEFAEGNMDLKKMEIFPDDVPISEIFDMIKSLCRDSHLTCDTCLRYVVRLVQRQIILSTARRLLLKEANKSRHSFDYSEREKTVTVHLVGGIDAFIEVPLNWPLSSTPLVLLSFNSSSQSQNLTLPLVGRVKTRANSLEHPRHNLVRFADAIEGILVQEMQSGN